MSIDTALMIIALHSEIYGLYKGRKGNSRENVKKLVSDHFGSEFFMATRLHQTYFVGVSGTLHVYLTEHVFEYFKSSREKPLICTFTFIDP